MNTEIELEPSLKRQLDAFRTVAPRDPQAAAAGKAAFLTHARALAPGVPPVRRRTSQSWFVSRPLAWRSASLAAATLLVLGLLLLSGAGMALAANASLPGEALYPLKTLGEGLKISFSGSDPAGQFALQREFVQQRTLEALALTQTGQPLPEYFLDRWEAQMEQMLQSGAQLDESNLQNQLLRIRTEWQAQARLLQMQQTRTDQAALQQVQTMYQQRLEWVETGLTDPQRFKQRFGSTNGDSSPPPALTPAHTTRPGPQPTVTPPGAGTSPTPNSTPQGTAPGSAQGTPAGTGQMQGAAGGPNENASTPGWPNHTDIPQGSGQTNSGGTQAPGGSASAQPESGNSNGSTSGSGAADPAGSGSGGEGGGSPANGNGSGGGKTR